TSFSTFSRLRFFTSSCESFSSRSKLFNSAFALFNWVCQESVLLSFSPKDSAALARAFSSVDIFSFCASISLFNTAFLAVISLFLQKISQHLQEPFLVFIFFSFVHQFPYSILHFLRLLL